MIDIVQTHQERQRGPAAASILSKAVACLASAQQRACAFSDVESTENPRVDSEARPTLG